MIKIIINTNWQKSIFITHVKQKYWITCQDIVFLNYVKYVSAKKNTLKVTIFIIFCQLVCPFIDKISGYWTYLERKSLKEEWVNHTREKSSYFDDGTVPPFIFQSIFTLSEKIHVGEKEEIIKTTATPASMVLYSIKADKQQVNYHRVFRDDNSDGSYNTVITVHFYPKMIQTDLSQPRLVIKKAVFSCQTVWGINVSWISCSQAKC